MLVGAKWNFKMEFIHGSFFVFFLHFVSAWGISYNTIQHEMSRATVHVPEIISKTCLLKPSHGPCRANFNMYYFEPTNMTCRRFEWGGCQGNGNRFERLSDCQNKCLSKPGQQPRPRYCFLRFDYGFCFGDTKRWYYDSIWQVCKEAVYSGCGGNKNNFYGQEQCESICRFGLGPITTPTTRSGLSKKVLVINPYDSTPQRGQVQITTTTAEPKPSPK